jgi:hypothetical protein
MEKVKPILATLRKYFRFSEGEIPHDAADMLFEVGKAHEALLYSLLFVPGLSIVEDSVLLTNEAQGIEERFLQAKRAGRMPLARLEASFNRVEIPFMFIDRNFGNDEEYLLADRIAEAWRGSLAHRHPDRRFVVTIIPREDNAGNIAVEFYENRG